MCIFCDTKRIMVAHKDGTGPLHLISHSIDLNLDHVSKNAQIWQFLLFYGSN